ncbi:hypothetical protein DL239_10185 [Sedimentitalea sp. CY04]|uniref:Uncharacterized protein n=2 Tax=Parasedimentitalea denitrificans TaxID=2211118 RepID=A0ABX0W6X3_9RHOB|nr:hypothetical protein [Sedimentitalea sp. CY04]
MLTLRQAQGLLDKHLANSNKAAHSRIVAHLMRRIAEKLQVTAQWLEGRLPVDALGAIKAHDHRTGVLADTQIANALKLADALAIADACVGRDVMMQIGTFDGLHNLALCLETRPYLPPIIFKYSITSLQLLIDNAPRQ